MPYDLFISYSRRDNERGQVTALKAQIESSFRAFAGRDLRVFFDTQEIAGMDDWRQKIQRSLRDSQVFLAVLSPHYLASPYCRWEWEDYVRYEAMRQCLGEGVAPVFFVTLPDAADPKTDQALACWIDEIQRRQTFDLRPWHDAGEQALQQAHVRQTLEQLHASVRERLDRAERSRRSPNNLIKHNPAFVGRVRELTELRNALTKNKLGVVGAREGQMPGRATVQGLGGMGKTELALAYAHAFAWDYPGGRWQIPCEHVSDLRVALLHLANAKALNFEFTEDEKKNIALAFERVLRELNRRERCLLILDNVSDSNLLQPEFLDRLPRDGRVDLIATTRLAPRAIPGSAQEQTFIAVDELPEEDALALMRSHQPEGRFASQQEDDEARAIVRLLRGFTLAVETAAIYLGRDTAPDACRRFRERLSPDLLRESETAATDSAVAVRHRVRSLEEALAFTLQTLTPETLHLLEIASLLPADQIALPWLKVVGAQKFPAFIVEPSEPNSAFQQAEELLLGLRLFQSSGVVDNDRRLLVVRMHRLVQELVRLGIGENARTLEEALLAYAKTRVESLADSWLQHQHRWELTPLATCAWSWMERESSDGAYLASQLAVPLQSLARFSEGERLLRRAVAISERSLRDDDPNFGTLLGNLGSLLQAMNQLAESESLKRRALLIVERCYGGDHPEVARCINNLAQLLKATNRFAEAEPLLRRALMIDERYFGQENSTIARRLSNLAQLFQATNRLSEAEPLLRRALAVHEKCTEPNHPEIAVCLTNLAGLLLNTNRLTEAEPLMRRALAIDEENFGPEHPQVALHVNNLGTLLQDANRLSDAEPLFRRALSIFERNFGANHPKVAVALDNLARLCQVTRRLSEAETLIRRALAIDEESLGPDHTEVASRLNNLASILWDLHRFSEAEPLMKRALAISERSHGPNHPEVAICLNNLSQFLKERNRLTDAEPLMARGIKIFLHFAHRTGREHPHLPAALRNYSVLLEQMGLSAGEILERIHSLGNRG